MADANQWIPIIGAGIGAAAALLGSALTAGIKHFSDIRQKKLEREWKLEDENRQRLFEADVVEQQRREKVEDENRQRQFDADAEERQRREKLLSESDHFGRLRLEALSAETPGECADALEDTKRWVSEHPQWMRSSEFEELYIKFLSENFLFSLTRANDLQPMHQAQALLRDKFEPLTVDKILSE